MNVIISADVSSSMELITIRSLTLLGIEAENNIITVNPASSANAGKVMALGTPNTNIRINYLPTMQLTHVEENNTLIFNYNLAGNTEDDQSTSELINSSDRDFRLNDTGRFYIWIGGSIDITQAIPGNYRGEFILEVEYI